MISKYYKGIQKKVYLPHSCSILEIQLMEFSSNTDICVVTPGMGGGTLIFSHIRTLGPFWGVQILNFNIYFFFFGGGGSKK